jgi:type I restriction enzyme M protein
MLAELIDLVSGNTMGEQGDKAKDILGRVYEYFPFTLCAEWNG